MRIGIVLSKPPGYSETFFLSKIKGLKAHGHEVLLFVHSEENSFDLCKVKTTYPLHKRNILKQLFWFGFVFFKLLLHFKKVWTFVKLERLAKHSWVSIFKRLYGSAHILTDKLDWLHFGFATMALGKEHVAKSIGAKMAVSFRGFDMAIYPIKYPNCYDLLWKQVDKVHSISDDLYQLALKNGLPSTVAYKKITPAIDVDLFTSSSTNGVFDGKCLKMITVARLHWKKGLTYTFMALKQLKEQGLCFQYTIVGEGDEYEKLMYLRLQLGLENEVRLIGKVVHNEVKELLLTHDIYIQYSISEGFCNAVLEAQAMGLLCVVSDAEGLPENVLHNQSGWVVPKRQPKKLAESIQKVATLNEADKNRIRKFAIKRVQEEFNLEKQSREFLKFYNV